MPVIRSQHTRQKRFMSRRSALMGVFALGLAAGPALAGDSLRGKITAILGPDLATFDYGAGTYTIRIAGLDTPKTAGDPGKAQSFISSLVLNKNVRLRLVEHEEDGEEDADGGAMLVRLQTADPETGYKDVSIELIKAGLAHRQAGFDFKYSELEAAENEAKLARRGLWSAQ
jgi:endonuclease YncB( thermonuclease family)